jgi:hypothetical protein
MRATAMLWSATFAPSSVRAKGDTAAENIELRLVKLPKAVMLLDIGQSS